MDIIGKRKYFYMGSLALIAVGLVFLGLFKLNLGIEFRSGTSFNILFLKEVDTESLRGEFIRMGHKETFIQKVEREAILVEMGERRGVDEVADLLGKKFGVVRVLELKKEPQILVLLFEKMPGMEDLKKTLASEGFSVKRAEKIKTPSFYVRTRALEPEKRDERGNIIAPSEEERIKKELEDKFGPLAIYDVYTISPMIALERTKYTIYAIIGAAFGILVYITWAFRRLKRPLRYGICALIALLHDVLVVLGLFAIMGKFFDIRVNSMFIIGVLTIIGYSVNDTIVVFDRIRENRLRMVGTDFEVVANRSLLETLGRSLNTSLTTLFVLLALLFIGGPVLRSFILALLIGIISGTYSSIFIASPLLVSWEKGELYGIIRMVRKRRR